MARIIKNSKTKVKETSDLILKVGSEFILNSEFSIEEIKIVEKCSEKCLSSLEIREI